MSLKKLLLVFSALIALSGCTSSNVYTVNDLDAVVFAVKEEFGDDYYPSMEIPESLLLEVYGIDVSRVEAYYAMGPMFTMNVDTMLVFIAQEDYIDELHAALIAYQNYLINDSFQYPMNFLKVEASKIYVKDNLLAFVMIGGFTMDFEDESFYENESQRALSAIRSVLE
jgi:hypothetical protein